MPPVVSVIGRKRAGKTTVLERLIAALKAKGYRIATIKHHIHYGFCMDSPGKDTWRHSAAGADAVAISSPDRLVVSFTTPKEMMVGEIVERFMGDADIVLTEGYARAETPKILVATSEEDLELFSATAGGEIVAVVSDASIHTDYPTFGFGEVPKLAEFIVERFVAHGQGYGAHRAPD
ncbi:MAG: molybdopterin-guanine dinucleotide biosynthesis protein B [Euryarchaeota archaeon]|nr:molybdopterin-guanine dinucleotide biosynthesis protein B [Euryarchaeota archaeon]